MAFIKSYNRKEIIILSLRFYELVFIVRPDATSSHVESLAQSYTKIFKDHGGEVAKTEFCGLRALAYPINKHKKGHYVLFNIEATAEGVKEVERQMRISEDVLRYLTIRIPALDSNPSPLMQQKSYREGRRSYDEEYEPFPTRTPSNTIREPR